MASKSSFFKDNFVLIVGLTLPVLLMLGFMLASSLPNINADPPQHDFVFAVPAGGDKIPISLQLTVGKDSILRAQYTRNATRAGYSYNSWKKLYVFEARTQKVRELPLPYPDNMEEIKTVRTEIVDATKTMKLDTTLESPDGYSLSYDGYSRSGLVGDLFIGGRYRSEPRLRKGRASVKLISSNSQVPFYYGSVEFIGWSVGSIPPRTQAPGGRQ
jgi:hypothetical protein